MGLDGMVFNQKEIQVLKMALEMYGFTDFTVSDALAVRDIMSLVKLKGDLVSVKDITGVGSRKRDPEKR